MILTNYGIKNPGCSKFVIIAPHAGGDDLKTGLIAKKIAEKLNGFLIVNRNYIKPKNSQSKNKPEKTADFNELRWSQNLNKYIWEEKHNDMLLFFDDIKNYCEEAKKFDSENKAIAIYIHGIHSDKIGIDIGAGMRKHNTCSNKIFGSKKHKEIGENTGTITLKINIIKQLKKELDEKIKEKYDLKATVGESYSGWSKQSAIQFHKHEGRDDYAIQFEISHLLRQKNNLNYTAEILANVLKKTLG